MPQNGYVGGNKRQLISFRTGLLGSDSTGAVLNSRINQVKQRLNPGNRGKTGSKRW